MTMAVTYCALNCLVELRDAVQFVAVAYKEDSKVRLALIMNLEEVRSQTSAVVSERV